MEWELDRPLAVAIPPPGGLVSYSYSFDNSGGSSLVPTNWTVFAFQFLNWSAVKETPVTLAGWGSNIGCPALKLMAPKFGNGSGEGIPLVPGVPGGVGERTILPEIIHWGSTSTPYLNASYPASPLGTFSWNLSHGDLYTDFSNLSAFTDYAAPYQPTPGAPFAGMTLQVSVDEVGFGVPIHLLNGTEVTIASGTPEWLPGSSLIVHMTYIYPGSGDNQTWAMYSAGVGSPFPLGGYLFDQLT